MHLCMDIVRIRKREVITVITVDPTVYGVSRLCLLCQIQELHRQLCKSHLQTHYHRHCNCKCRRCTCSNRINPYSSNLRCPFLPQKPYSISTSYCSNSNCFSSNNCSCNNSSNNKLSCSNNNLFNSSWRWV